MSGEVMPTPLTAQVAVLNTDGAKVALAAAEAKARADGLKVSISVVDAFGNLIAFLRLDGAPLSTVEASLAKARTAAKFGFPSKVFEDVLNGGNVSMLAFTDSVCPSQGGVPVIAGAVCVGGVGGSGGSGEEDERVAQAGADGLVAALQG